jgi:hypothetical protein
LAGFLAFGKSLWVAKLASRAAKFPKVSGRRSRNYRFGETAGRDPVRSPLLPGSAAEFSPISGGLGLLFGNSAD